MRVHEKVPGSSENVSREKEARSSMLCADRSRGSGSSGRRSGKCRDRGRQCRERHPQCKWNHTAPERAQESLASAVPPVTGPPSLTGPLNPPHSLAPRYHLYSHLPVRSQGSCRACLVSISASLTPTGHSSISREKVWGKRPENCHKVPSAQGSSGLVCLPGLVGSRTAASR